MTHELRNEREANMAIDCCTANGMKDGCSQGDYCPHWGRVSKNVTYLNDRKPQKSAPAEVTHEQCKAMDDTLSASGEAPKNTTGSKLFDFFWMWTSNLFWERIYGALPIKFRMLMTRPWFKRKLK
jgi:hypothetical protein